METLQHQTSVAACACELGTDDLVDASAQHATKVIFDLPVFHMSSPRSCYEPFTPSAPRRDELEALQILRPVVENSHIPAALNFIELSLNDFVIYYDTPRYPCEMRCLHHLDTKTNHTNFYLDGVLSVADTRVFVRHVPISTIPIGNYGSFVSHSVRDHMWLQSELCRGSDVFYKLETPAKEYSRFFEPFAWVADLTKHIIDFMLIMAQNHIKVSIHHFRGEFEAWLLTVHGESPEFALWLAKHPAKDFRTSIVANIAFIYKEAFSVLGQEGVGFHTIWDEIMFFGRYPEQPLTQDASIMLKRNQTIVTDYIYRLFSHLPFGDRLQVGAMSSETQALRDLVIAENHLERSSLPETLAGPLEPSEPSPPLESSKPLGPSIRAASSCDPLIIRKIKAGVTISTRRDNETSGTRWMRERAYGFDDVDRWFGLVQAIRAVGEDIECEVLWYYRPVDTSCGVMKYPWSNELFLSDHCSCRERHKIQGHEILNVHEVEFGGDSKTTAEFFCRLVYISNERKWLALNKQDLKCSHVSSRKRSKGQYEVGETYLVKMHNSRSEPCELVAIQAGKPQTCHFRRFLRRKEVDQAASAARPNELVYSNQLIKCSETRITGKCHVRVFEPNEAIPTPYDRDGAGSFFYMTHRQTVNSDGILAYQALDFAPSTLQQGFDPTMKIPQLHGLDLFCGGGTFGRGLEEGGAIQMSWANDYDAKAIHTYMANSSHPDHISPFLGSVDDLFRQAIDGSFSKSVPRVGRVNFISGGSPCPGFSALTNDKTTDKQRKNQSLVAAFASFIDLYRPKYGVLENVSSIIQKHANRDQDVFSQLLCAIVGMGYQAQMMLLEACSYGAPQRRTRVFLVFAAPGCKLPEKPQQTHEDPPDTIARSLGKLSTGEAFLERNPPSATPFPFLTASQATLDLPRIYDGQVDTCIEFPDHRLAIGLTKLMRSRIPLIPKRPWAMDFLTASRTVLTPSQRACFKGTQRRSTTNPSQMREKSRSYGRMHPHRLMETIITKALPGDHKSGRCLHWDEDRTISVMEARRAQGYPDEEVLLGTPANQYKIVGNSVARQVALALGVSIREAWVDSHQGDVSHMVNRSDKEQQVNIRSANTGGDVLITRTSILTIASSDGPTAAPCSKDGPSSILRAIPTRKRSTNPQLSKLCDAPQKRSRV